MPFLNSCNVFETPIDNTNWNIEQLPVYVI